MQPQLMRGHSLAFNVWERDREREALIVDRRILWKQGTNGAEKTSKDRHNDGLNYWEEKRNQKFRKTKKRGLTSESEEWLVYEMPDNSLIGDPIYYFINDIFFKKINNN